MLVRHTPSAAGYSHTLVQGRTGATILTLMSVSFVAPVTLFAVTGASVGNRIGLLVLEEETVPEGAVVLEGKMMRPGEAKSSAGMSKRLPLSCAGWEEKEDEFVGRRVEERDGREEEGGKRNKEESEEGGESDDAGENDKERSGDGTEGDEDIWVIKDAGEIGRPEEEDGKAAAEEEALSLPVSDAMYSPNSSWPL